MREPAPGAEHGWLDVRVAHHLVRHVEPHRLGAVVAEAGFVLAEDPPTVRAPDVAFVARQRVPAEGPPRGYWPGAPDLAVEIASPSNTVAEILDKVRDYLEAGARTVWVVEPRTRGVTVHVPGGEPRVLREADVLDGGEVLPGFRLQVAELFAR